LGIDVVDADDHQEYKERGSHGWKL
jgi:hypothetical protein